MICVDYSAMFLRCFFFNCLFIDVTWHLSTVHFPVNESWADKMPAKSSKTKENPKKGKTGDKVIRRKRQQNQGLFALSKRYNSQFSYSNKSESPQEDNTSRWFSTAILAHPFQSSLLKNHRISRQMYLEPSRIFMTELFREIS